MKKENIVLNQEKSKQKQTQKWWTMELAGKDFKTAIINVHRDLKENINIMKTEMENIKDFFYKGQV